MSEEAAIATEPWHELEAIIASGNADHLEAFLQLLPPGETAYTISRLSDEDRTQLLSLIRPEFAADLIEYLSDEHAADVLEELPAATAAAIVDELDSDDQADILAELTDDDQQAILDRMDPEEAEDVRPLLAYEPDTAGGIMFTEYLAFPDSARVDDVIGDLRRKADEYAEYDVQYVYVVDEAGGVTGVVPLRNLLLSSAGKALTQVMIRDPVRVTADTTLEELETVFDRYDFYGVPVVDAHERVVGVVHRAAVEEALSERADKALLRFGGIIAGEELRTMPLQSRVIRRLAFLCPNLPLYLLSISIIAFFEPIVDEVTALAVFLPLVAGICGASSNQAIAVSMRELALGLVRPGDVLRVSGKEASLGLVNGLVLGSILGVTAWLWKGNPALGGVVLGAVSVGTVVAVLLGGGVPLVLKAVNVDPAMAAGPIVLTITDMAAFFTLLVLAQLLMPWLV